MGADGWMTELVRFFKTARHLWGRCPNCGAPFRLSDAAISSHAEPPRDWLRQLEQKRAGLERREATLEEEAAELESRESELRNRENDVRLREKELGRDARNLANEMLRNDSALKARIKDANRQAVMRSRAVLLGKMLECIAPCFRRFGHDPRDMRAIFNPIDYVLFDGLTVDRTVQEVTFIEVKSGTSSLTPAQRSIREAVQKRRVHWEVWEIGEPRVAISRQLANSRQLLPPADE